jgi:hypothetical protein
MKNVLAGVSTPWDLSESRGKRPQPNLQLTTFLFVCWRIMAYLPTTTYPWTPVRRTACGRRYHTYLERYHTSRPYGHGPYVGIVCWCGIYGTIPQYAYHTPYLDIDVWTTTGHNHNCEKNYY